MRARRRRDGAARRRQVVVRFSDAEWDLITGCAGDAGSAVGAWIGQLAVDAATGRAGAVGLPDLLRLHGDVLQLQSLFPGDVIERRALQELMARLDAAVDAVITEVEGRR